MLAAQLKQTIIKQLFSVYDEDESLAIANELLKFYALDTNKLEAGELELAKIALAIKRLLQNEPLQYVLGEAWFYNLPFYVNKHVLIPRPETEELVHLILEELRMTNYELRITNDEGKKSQITNHKSQILDIGTGSGCIPIALKKNLPQANVYGMDISTEAISVATQNAQRNNVEVIFFQGDILSANRHSGFDFAQPPQNNNSNPQLPTSNLQSPTSNPQSPLFNIIVSNPPYITEVERNEMHENVLAYEPHLALFVSDGNPLQFYEAISEFASRNLSANGKLYFEINATYGNEVKQCMEKYGFTDVSIVKDMQGKDRIVKGNFGVM